MLPYDIAYYRDRILSERAMVLTAESKAVALVHEAMAKQYESLLRLSKVRPILKIVPPVLAQ